MPNFICEACTVREELDRELTQLPPDLGLLALERARLIDMSHHWAEASLTQYHTKLNMLRRFGYSFGVTVLSPSVLLTLKPGHSDNVGTGAILARLLPATKSSPTIPADVVMAYTSASGLSIGKWAHRLRASLGYPTIPVSHERIFQHPDGTLWTSHFFRATYLWPLLHMQRLAGDAH
jgi:hypothetical protein